ncbi:MAG: efflux RND transporter periplasmic adaptor subunit [Phycisphaerae bacterium]|nr:efflux RND transporter periplasmic adaptor subunit [Phycisphaerae bacterium]
MLACWVSPDGTCSGQAPGPTRVEVAPVVLRDLAPTIRLVGTVRPCLRTLVASEVAGLVAELPVDEGDGVVKGQLICKLRDDRRRFAHAEALERQAQLTAELAERTAEFTKAKYEVDRTSRLWEQQRCTDKERQDARADCAAAEARVDQARHAVEAQKAGVEILADDLGRTSICSPCDGSVVAKHAELGSWVSQGGEIVELVDLSTARVRISVPEATIGYCEVGAEVQVSVEALGKVYHGAVSRVIPDAEERARTFPVEIDIANPAGELKAGMFARGAVPSGPRARQLVVPKDAVVLRGPMSMLYIVRDSEQGQMAMPLPVEVVSEVMDHVAVRAQGLVAGDQVVVRGNEYMFGPTPVIAMPTAPAAATQPARDTQTDGQTSEEPPAREAARAEARGSPSNG